MGVLRKIATMASEVAAVARGVDAWQLKAIYSAMPGLYEWLWDEAPPASGTQEIRGEDHSGSTADGGVGIPRNCIACVGYGSGDNFMWKTFIKGPPVWTLADVGYTPQRSAIIGGYHFRAYVDVELDTATYPGLYAEGWLFVSFDGVLDTRINNITTGSASAVTTVTVGPGEILAIHIRDIPIAPDTANSFGVEYQTNDEGGDVVTYGCIISEVYRAGAESYNKYNAPLTQPPTAGEVP